MADRVELADRLRLLRTARKLTQRELAEAAGVEQSTVSSAETGARAPFDETVQFYAQALDVLPIALTNDTYFALELLRIVGVDPERVIEERQRMQHSLGGPPPRDEDAPPTPPEREAPPEDAFFPPEPEPEWFRVAKALSDLPPEKLTALAHIVEAMKPPPGTSPPQHDPSSSGAADDEGGKSTGRGGRR
jgi:transcriptional regulator with XRE-family HTH domain